METGSDSESSSSTYGEQTFTKLHNQTHFEMPKLTSTHILEIPPLFSGGAKTRRGIGLSQGLKENNVKVLFGGQSISDGAKTRGVLKDMG